jgi:cation:H+ antiporter
MDIGVFILASLVLFVSMFTGERRSLDRWEGGLLLAVYILYIGYLVLRG